MDPTIIIGSGQAGLSVAREYRKLDPTGPLTLLSADDGRVYSKPMLSNALAKGKTADSLASADADQLAQQLGITVRAGQRVERIEPAARQLSVGGETLRYRALVLALGADPIQIPLAGDGAQDVLSINDLGDYARFRARLEGSQRVAIMGAGLIGCEFANDLAGSGIHVDVIDPMPQVLGRLLPAQSAEGLQQALAALGVNWHLGTVVQEVRRSAQGLSLILANGTTLETELVLSAVGLRPHISLAQQAGLAVGRGIIVDRYLQTSTPGIYALGDCAEVEGLVLPFIMPIMQAARALAKTLAGETSAVHYPAMPVVVKTPALPLVISPPAADAQGHWELTPRAVGISARFVSQDGALLGFALSGEAISEKQALSRELPALLS